MSSVLIEKNNASSLFDEIVKKVMKEGEVSDSRIGKTKRICNVSLVLTNPENWEVNLPYRKTPKKYVEAELKWYNSANPSVEFIKDYAKIWGQICDNDGKANSNYGYTIKKKYEFDQFEYCFNHLKKSKFDRQAIIHLKWAGEDFGLDTPCTIMIQFMIFKDKLETHTYMRSNDAFWGFCNDIAYFTYLQREMFKKLKEIYPEIELGKYYHTVGDFHIYERDWGKIPLE